MRARTHSARTPVKSFIRFVFNAHGEIGAFPFDENFLAFMARFITSRRARACYNCYSGGFISLRFTCHGRKARPLNVTHVSLRAAGSDQEGGRPRLEIQAKLNPL